MDCLDITWTDCTTNYTDLHLKLNYLIKNNLIDDIALSKKMDSLHNKMTHILEEIESINDYIDSKIAIYGSIVSSKPVDTISINKRSNSVDNVSKY
jgi:hypothetical protein